MLSSSGSPSWTRSVKRTPPLILESKRLHPIVDGYVMVDTVVSELAASHRSRGVGHRRSPRAEFRGCPLQLEHLLSVLPESARIVLSSRRDPPIRLHRLRLADEVAELRAGDLRFTVSETRELLAASEISLSDSGQPR